MPGGYSLIRGLCGPKGYGFLAVLVINRASVDFGKRTAHPPTWKYMLNIVIFWRQFSSKLCDEEGTEIWANIFFGIFVY